MSGVRAFVRSWRVGELFRVELSCPVPRPLSKVAAVMTWDPCGPNRLTAKELADYRAGRAAALRDLAELGVRVAVLDL